MVEFILGLITVIASAVSVIFAGATMVDAIREYARSR